MKGHTLLIPADDAQPITHTEHTEPLSLPFLQQAVGGYIEAVPGFSTVDYGGELLACCAFCNEEGKLKAMPLNLRATAKWVVAQHRAGAIPALNDILVGPVLLVWGDAAFMAEL